MPRRKGTGMAVETPAYINILRRLLDHGMAASNVSRQEHESEGSKCNAHTDPRTRDAAVSI